MVDVDIEPSSKHPLKKSRSVYSKSKSIDASFILMRLGKPATTGIRFEFAVLSIAEESASDMAGGEGVLLGTLPVSTPNVSELARFWTPITLNSFERIALIYEKVAEKGRWHA